MGSSKIISIFLNIIFFPLSKKSFTSAQKMKLVQGDVKALQIKYKSDPKKIIAKTLQGKFCSFFLIFPLNHTFRSCDTKWNYQSPKWRRLWIYSSRSDLKPRKYKISQSPLREESDDRIH